MSQQINLVSPTMLGKRYAFGLREMAIGLGLVLLCALAWSGFVYVQAKALESQAEQQEARQATAQAELDRLTAAASRPVSALLSEQVRATHAKVIQREALLEAININFKDTSAGFSARMRALANSSMDGVWLNGFTFAAGYVALKGSAMDAELLTSYLNQLGEQAPFNGLRFSGINASDAQASATGKAGASALPDHLDFDLYSGTLDATAKAGTPHGQ